MPCDIVLNDRSLMAGKPVVLVHRDLLATPLAPSVARGLLGSALHAESAGPQPDVIWTAQLLTSELVTNAVVHACTRLHIGVARGDDALLIAVADGDPQLPRQVPESCDYEESGRGMALIAALADDFGWRLRTDTTGKIMWVLLSLAAG